MDFRTPEPILSALHKALDHGIIGYEFMPRRLQETVAARMTRLYGWQVDPDWVVPTPGVVSGFNIAARAVCSDGDGVLIQPPVYHMFFEMYKNLQIIRQIAPFSFATEGNILCPQLDLGSFAAAFHSNNARTRMFLLCHPHNPTGQVFTRDELKGMAEICLQNETVIVSDEIHSELLLGDAKHIPMATLSPEIAERTVTLIAPSKTFNVAGLFCAFAIIPNPELRKRFQSVADHITAHVASLGLVSAEAAFSGACDDWLMVLRTYLGRNRDFLVDYSTRNFPEVCLTIPDATYLSWINFGEYARSGKIQGIPHRFFLERAKVATTEGGPFGDGYESFVRLNFGCPRSILEEALDRIQEALEV
jgi:cystathionine beta-lyase